MLTDAQNKLLIATKSLSDFLLTSYENNENLKNGSIQTAYNQFKKWSDNDNKEPIDIFRAQKDWIHVFVFDPISQRLIENPVLVHHQNPSNRQKESFFTNGNDENAKQLKFTASNAQQLPEFRESLHQFYGALNAYYCNVDNDDAFKKEIKNWGTAAEIALAYGQSEVSYWQLAYQPNPPVFPLPIRQAQPMPNAAGQHFIGKTTIGFLVLAATCFTIAMILWDHAENRVNPRKHKNIQGYKDATIVCGAASIVFLCLAGRHPIHNLLKRTANATTEGIQHAWQQSFQRRQPTTAIEVESLTGRNDINVA